MNLIYLTDVKVTTQDSKVQKTYFHFSSMSKLGNEHQLVYIKYYKLLTAQILIFPVQESPTVQDSMPTTAIVQTSILSFSLYFLKK